MRLHFLTNNDDPNLQQKMRFFADHFLYVNQFIGTVPHIPFDNPLSLLDKIVFQIENNVERCLKYVNHYWESLGSYDQLLANEYGKFYQPVKDIMNEFLGNEKEKAAVAWIKGHPAFFENLRALHAELEGSLFDKMFLWLNNYLQCVHDLKHHMEDIKFVSHILVSLYRLSGFSKESVDDFIQRILSGDKYKFPFPMEVYNHNKEEAYIQIADDYIKQRDFTRQLEGLKNIMINSKTRCGYFVYVIDNCRLMPEFANSFKIHLGETTFISPEHDELIELKNSVNGQAEEESSDIYPRFFGPDKILCYVKLNYEDCDKTKKVALKQINADLTKLNAFLKSDLKVNGKNDLFTDNFKNDDWHSTTSVFERGIVWIDQFDYRDLKNNPYEQLSNSTSPAKEKLLHNESVFIKAANGEGISYYWQYVENMFWFQQKGADKIREKFINVLQKQTHEIINLFLLNVGLLFDAYTTSGHEDEIGLSVEQMRTIRKSCEEGNDELLLKFRNKIIHPFLREIIQDYRNLKATGYRTWNNFFSSLILELYDVRNSKTHSGRVNENSEIKLSYILPPIMNRARWYIIHLCKDNETLSHEQLLEKAIS